MNIESFRLFDLIPNKVVYFMAPKCGSRTIMAYAYLYRNPQDWDNSPALYVSPRFRYSNLYKFQKTLRIKTLPSPYPPIRLCVVRDPIKRFISAFANRVNRLKKVESGLTIAEYIKNRDDPAYKEEYRDLNEHLIPLYVRCGTEPRKIYTHIFDVSQLSEVHDLLENVGGVKLPILHLHKSTDEEKPTLTPEQIEWVKEYYKKDYEIYGRWIK
jgi:hypothetical protein